ncbi:MAG TPA: M13 family metallopeptidase [Lacunisphaera sp.]|nr:M13 family metallopeptidase [Lacunisphaera sp.]
MVTPLALGRRLVVAAASLVLLHSLPAAGLDRAGMDPAVAPGDDFYRYANGQWLKTTEIPSDRSNWGPFRVLAELTNTRLRELVETAGRDRVGASPAARLVGDFYRAYMDESAIEARGLASLQPWLDRVGGLKDKSDLARALGESIRADVDPLNATNFITENLFGLWVAQGLDDPAHNTPYLLQGGLGMPDREYYLADNEHMQDIRAKYRRHIAAVLRLAGRTDADARAERIYALELALAQAHSSRADSEDVQKANHPWRRAEFPVKAPGMDWAAFFAGAQLADQDRFILWHEGAVVGAAALVGREPLEVWKDWLAYHAINQHSDALPKAFADERFAFNETVVNGTPEQPARWKRTLTAANQVMPDAIGQVYVAKYFPASSKARVQAMVANIVHAFDERIGRLDWMAPATKAQARAKLKALYVGIGYPDKWDNYDGLAIDPADAAGNVMRAEAFRYRRAIEKLHQPVDATEWCMSPQEVNAVNMPMQNALDFPAAILQPPFFDPAAPDAVNYGGIGTVIGHEISHSFDDQGAQFDSHGLLRNWWTPDDLDHFHRATAALVAQYSSYRPFPDLALNGQQTLSENLADLAGVSASFDAWRAEAGGHAAIVDGFTGEQQFFLSFAQIWRTKYRDAALRQRVIADGHSPGQYRALMVRNIDGWYEAFGVKPGQALYLAPADRVRVW